MCRRVARGGLDPGAPDVVGPLAVEVADIGVHAVELTPSFQAYRRLSWEQRER